MCPCLKIIKNNNKKKRYSLIQKFLLPMCGLIKSTLIFFYQDGIDFQKNIHSETQVYLIVQLGDLLTPMKGGKRVCTVMIKKEVENTLLNTMKYYTLV